MMAGLGKRYAGRKKFRMGWKGNEKKESSRQRSEPRLLIRQYIKRPLPCDQHLGRSLANVKSHVPHRTILSTNAPSSQFIKGEK